MTLAYERRARGREMALQARPMSMGVTREEAAPVLLEEPEFDVVFASGSPLAGTILGGFPYQTGTARRGEAYSVVGDYPVSVPPQSTEDLVDAIMDRMYGQHCAKAVVKCQHCFQWAARYCACKQCGAPVD